MNVLVFANGTPPSRPLVKTYLRNSSLIVAADGGANALVQLHLHPDFIVGDLDSLSEETKRHFPNATLVERVDQNKTDLEKTLDFCLEQGAKEILVLGATGERLDHELANLGILQQFSRRVKIALVDEQFLVRVVRGELTVKTIPRQVISLLALQPALGVSLHGVKFPLNNARLNFGGRGVSNIALGTEIFIQIEKGEAFLFLAHHVE